MATDTATDTNPMSNDTVVVSTSNYRKPPRLYDAIALTVLVAVLTLVWIIHPTDSYKPSITIQPADETYINFIFHPSRSTAACQRRLNLYANDIGAQCEDCDIATSCIKSTEADPLLDAGESQFLEIDGGRVAFISPSSETSKAICLKSASALDGSVVEVKDSDIASCSDGVAEVKSRGTSGYFVFIKNNHLQVSGVISVLIGLVVIASAIRYRRLSPSEQVLTGNRQLSAVATILTDVLTVTLIWNAINLSNESVQPLEQSTFIFQITLLATLMCLWFGAAKKQYTRPMTLHDELRQTLKAIILIGLFHTSLVAFTASSAPITPLIFWTGVFALIPTCRYLLRSSLDRFSVWRRPVVIIGRGKNADRARRAIESDFTLGYKILEVELLNNGPKSEVCHIDSLAADTYAASRLAQKVRFLVALDSLQSDESQQILNQLLRLDRSIDVVPSLSGLPGLGANVSHFFGSELLLLSVKNNLAKTFHRLIKRVFDVVASSLLITIASPALVFLALQIRLDGGPVFFKQSRVGKDGRAFNCFKLRSMHVDAEKRLAELLETDDALKEEWSRNFKLSNDPRVTKIGGFCRRTSLDELPQLINVLIGDMSLVGPRPLLFNEIDRYGDSLELYQLVRPGITGAWQISGRSNTTFEDRIALDEWYIRNWSIYYDVFCLIKTIGVVFDKEGAY